MKFKITPCLWFDGQAESAAKFYTSVFPGSQITDTSYYTEAGAEHGHVAGRVMLVAFELAGQPFTALNGGPHFKFSEAISFQVEVETQEENDYYWNKLKEGGPVEAQQCGWLKDQFGVSWQIVPAQLPDLFGEGDPARAKRVMGALLKMKQLDIAELQRAAAA